MEKKCTKCWDVKQNTCFWKSSRNKSWLRAECNDCRKLYTKENKAYINAKSKEYYILNKEACNKRSHQHYLDNIEERKAYQRVQGKIWAKTEEWKKSRNISAQKRRIKINSLDDGTINMKTIDELLFLQFNKCLICDCNIENNYHIDHIKPIADWGENSKYNIQLLCPTCNIKKSNKYEW